MEVTSMGLGDWECISQGTGVTSDIGRFFRRLAARFGADRVAGLGMMSTARS